MKSLIFAVNYNIIKRKSVTRVSYTEKVRVQKFTNFGRYQWTSVTQESMGRGAPKSRDLLISPKRVKASNM